MPCREVIPGLRAHPTTLVFLAYRDAEPVGLAVCIGVGVDLQLRFSHR